MTDDAPTPPPEPPVEPAVVLRNPDNPRQVAIKSGPAVTAYEYWLFDADNGGGPAPNAEYVEGWTSV